ncbi:hypothetical protein Drose_06325 [Dactylosporangium roseum]|uniref:Uncharacterized protein n=1 Tax=Dactylosporangium roseum TaxID=47989 RepID=A0ABY5ZA73_9ACTN|nr:hypothetical protein [Dactylosporangium roseum]UWZ37888.1 hypothetical protein Drose_06325 [Dactylosporangium roseum]
MADVHTSVGLWGYTSMRCANGLDGCDDQACICLCHHRLGPYEEQPFGCPACRTILDAGAAGGCPDRWHAANRPDAEAPAAAEPLPRDRRRLHERVLTRCDPAWYGLRDDPPKVFAALRAVVELCVAHQADAVDGRLTDVDLIPPSEVLAAIALELGIDHGGHHD